MSVVLVLLIISLWVAAGLLQAVRKRASERFAAWALPASQATTFRVAHLLARCAHALAPTRLEPMLSRVFVLAPEYPVARIDVPITIAGEPRFWSGTFIDGEPWAAVPTVPEGTYIRFLGRDDNPYGFANPRLHVSPWEAPEAAIAELAADLAGEERVAQPIRMVLPLVAQALLIRWRNIEARGVVARASWAMKHGDDEQCGEAVAKIAGHDIRI